MILMYGDFRAAPPSIWGLVRVGVGAKYQIWQERQKTHCRFLFSAKLGSGDRENCDREIEKIGIGRSTKLRSGERENCDSVDLKV